MALAGGAVTDARDTLATSLLCLAFGGVTGVAVARALPPAGRGSYAGIVVGATVAATVGHLSVGSASASRWWPHRAALIRNSTLLGPVYASLAAIFGGALVVLVAPVRPATVLAVAVAVAGSIIGAQLTPLALMAGRADA